MHEADQTLELTFGSELNGNLEANLDSVSLIKFLNDKPIGHYCLNNTGEYFETLYKYNANKITSITEKYGEAPSRKDLMRSITQMIP